MPAVHVNENGFKLMSLPEPPGKGVTGLIGANRLGKTTSLMLLSGKKEPSVAWPTLIAGHKGTALAGYLRDLEAAHIRTSYKPQGVEWLRHIADGRKFLFDLNIDDEYVKALDLQEVLNKPPEKVNANEAQRVALSASLSKDADYYFLDQPTDHLDVWERLVIARLLKEKGRTKSVLVADHDLAFLSACCSKASVFYGKEAKQGGASSAYPTAKGISSFVGGYLPKEKAKLREKVPAAKEAKGGVCLIAWSGLVKDFDGFVASYGDGEVCVGERTALVGRNGLGKSGLLRLLAGQEKPDRGKISGKAAFSLKPQHITDKALQKVPPTLALMLGFAGGLKKPLSEDMRQRIAVAKCLAQRADVYLLDQPTEGLDVERRVVLARELQGRTAVVADHDLWFLSQACDKCVAFDGKPGMRGKARKSELKSAIANLSKEAGISPRI